MTPTVSVVIATYNYDQYLPHALDSVLAQTYQDYEIVLVDDGSTDATSEVAQHYRKERRLRYFPSEHMGQSAAKNLGIELARGKYIAFLDADDGWLPSKLEKQVSRFRSDPALGVVYTRRFWIDKHGRRFAKKEGKLHRGNVLPQMFRDNFVCFASSMVRRDVLIEAGRFDESIPLSIDYDLWLKIAAKHRFDYLDEPLVEYRTGHANLSRRGEERLQIALRIMDRFLNERGGKEKIPPLHVRRCYAETYANLAYLQRSKSHSTALTSYLKALTYRPWSIAAWWGAVKLTLPDGLRSRLSSLKQKVSLQYANEH